MFLIHFPTSFKVGDTIDCRINREPARVTYRDEDTLVIEPDDARKIVYVHNDDGNMVSFVCSDAGSDGSNLTINIPRPD